MSKDNTKTLKPGRAIYTTGVKGPTKIAENSGTTPKKVNIPAKYYHGTWLLPDDHDDEEDDQLEMDFGDQISDDLIDAIVEEAVSMANEDKKKDKEEKDEGERMQDFFFPKPKTTPGIRKECLEKGICPECARDLEMNSHGLVCPIHGVDY